MNVGRLVEWVCAWEKRGRTLVGRTQSGWSGGHEDG